jgi:hypothetical protein
MIRQPNYEPELVYNIIFWCQVWGEDKRSVKLPTTTKEQPQTQNQQVEEIGKIQPISFKLL